MTRFAVLLIASLPLAVEAMAQPIAGMRNVGVAGERGFIGVMVQPFDEAAIERRRRLHPNLPAVQPGILVSGLRKDGPAQRAGLAVGDIMITVDDAGAGKNLTSLRRAMQGWVVGKTTRVRRLRIEPNGLASEADIEIVPINLNAVEKLELTSSSDDPRNALPPWAREPIGVIDEDFARHATASPPTGWTVVEPPGGEAFKWRIANKGEKAGNVLQVVAPTSNPAGLSLCINDEVLIAGNNILRVMIRADGGQRVGAGGIVWGFQNVNNFYMALLDFAKNEAVVYKVENGNRRRMEARSIALKNGVWHDLRVDQTQGRIIVRLFSAGESRRLLENSRDTSFKDGQIGLVAIGDSDLRFDDVLARTQPTLIGGS